MRTRTAARAGVITAGFAMLVLVTAGCGAGQVAQTATQTTATGGVGGGVGSIQVRDAKVVADRPVVGDAVYRPGQNAPLQLTIVNNATMPDARLGPERLVAVRSPIARSGVLLGDTRIPEGQTLVAGYRRPVASVTLPGAREVGIVLLGLTQPVRVGMTYPVVLVFEGAGELRLELPVENQQLPPP